MQRLRAVLKAIMLRRMKDSEIDGKPILNLPPKTEEVVHVVFSEDESKYYRDLEAKSRIQFNKYLRAGTVGKHYSNILVLLLRLRQACCHPHLNLDFEVEGGGDLSAIDLVALAESLDESVISRIKEIEAFECPICYDAALNPSLAIPCGHDTCSACFQQLTESSMQNNLRAGRENDAQGKCPQCRGPVDPRKVIDYKTFVRVHMPEKAVEMGLDAVKAEETEFESATDSEDEDETSSDFDDADVDDNGDLKEFINDDLEFDEDLDDLSDIFHPEQATPSGPSSSKATNKSKKRSKKGKEKGKSKLEAVKPHMLKDLRRDAGKNKEARRRYMRYLHKNWETSAKVTKACELLQKIHETGEKTIIFSVWTGLLDLLEIPIKHDLQLKYCRYDGSMSATQRDQAAQHFMEDPNVKVMLVSLKAGNSGLNLTSASQVIIMDPFWNPYIEMQAIDRTHRIGQQRPVHVHRILVEESVEDRIVKLQQRKRDLIDSALDEGESKNLARLSVRELQFLFGVQN